MCVCVLCIVVLCAPIRFARIVSVGNLYVVPNLHNRSVGQFYTYVYLCVFARVLFVVIIIFILAPRAICARIRGEMSRTCLSLYSCIKSVYILYTLALQSLIRRDVCVCVFYIAFSVCNACVLCTHMRYITSTWRAWRARKCPGGSDSCVPVRERTHTEQLALLFVYFCVCVCARLAILVCRKHTYTQSHTVCDRNCCQQRPSRRRLPQSSTSFRRAQNRTSFTIQHTLFTRLARARPPFVRNLKPCVCACA